MGLQIQAFAGSIGGDQNSERMLGRLTVERLLDCFPFINRRRPMVNSDPFAGPIRILDSAGDLLVQVSFRVVVFGEDEDPKVGPFRSKFAHVSAHVLANPCQ